MVYTMIGLAGLGVGAAAYFGFTFSPIESALTAVMFVVVAMVAMERRLRRRAEDRLETAIEELTRLFSTDAQAGAVLSQRINALVEADPARRLDGLEADMSVLGTVVRQVAEAVADLEAVQHEAAAPQAAMEDDRMEVVPFEVAPEQAISPEALDQALQEGRLVLHVQPIVGLPQRRPQAFDLVPRLAMEDGSLAEAADFMPRRGSAGLVRRIDGMTVEEAMSIGKRVRAVGQPLPIHVPISRSTLGDAAAIGHLAALLDADRTVAANLVFVIGEAVWQGLDSGERAGVDSLLDKGAGLSLADSTTLRFDYAGLAARGVRSVRVDVGSFLEAPDRFTDFLSSDIAAYVKRFGIDLVFTGISSEEQIIILLEDGLTMVSGPHIAGPGPVRPDLLVDRAGPVAVPVASPPRRAGL